ncbi:MAG: hypothetical protein ACKO9U_03895 [Dolichospermum sp.]
MGFGNLTLRIIWFSLIAGGALMTVIDAAMSTEWISKMTNAASVNSSLPFILALVNTSVVSATGAVLTNPSSWHFVLTGGKQIGSIKDDLERITCFFGVALLIVFLIVGITSALWIDIISNFHKTRNWPLALAISLSGNFCFLFANYISLSLGGSLSKRMS